MFFTETLQYESNRRRLQYAKDNKTDASWNMLTTTSIYDHVEYPDSLLQDSSVCALGTFNF